MARPQPRQRLPAQRRLRLTLNQRIKKIVPRALDQSGPRLDLTRLGIGPGLVEGIDAQLELGLLLRPDQALLFGLRLRAGGRRVGLELPIDPFLGRLQLPSDLLKVDSRSQQLRALRFDGDSAPRPVKLRVGSQGGYPRGDQFGFGPQAVIGICFDEALRFDLGLIEKGGPARCVGAQRCQLQPRLRELERQNGGQSGGESWPFVFQVTQGQVGFAVVTQPPSEFEVRPFGAERHSDRQAEENENASQ